MKTIKTYRIAIITGVITSVIFIALFGILKSLDFDNRFETFLQIALLIITILTYHKIIGKEKGYLLINGIIIILLFSVLTNEFLWIYNPTSEVQPINIYIEFILNNNFIILIGIATLIIKLGARELIKKVKINNKKEITKR